MAKNYFLHISAKEAFKSYVRAYDSHHLKQIFDVGTLDIAKVAASFGFTSPPAVELNAKAVRPRKRHGGGGLGKFNSMNKGDKKVYKFVQPPEKKRKNKN